jgi:hypothetical protein
MRTGCPTSNQLGFPVISLFTLDQSYWWTPIGIAFKYTIILAAVLVGVWFFRGSKAGYFFFGWPLVVLLPLVALAFTEGLFGPFVKPSQQNFFVYLWIAVALIEFFLIWIPLIGLCISSLTGDRSDENQEKIPTNDAGGRET